MTANKHTPQDWLRGGTTVYALNAEGTNRFSAQVQGGWSTSGRNRTEPAELEANARLIASAPELLEALSTKVKTQNSESSRAGWNPTAPAATTNRSSASGWRAANTATS